MDNSDEIWTTVSSHESSEGIVRYQRSGRGRWRILRETVSVTDHWPEVLADVAKPGLQAFHFG